MIEPRSHSDPLRINFIPRQWQAAAYEKWSHASQGVVQVVTGGGKTAFAAMCMVDFLGKVKNGHILIVVPTISLLDQWYLDIQDYLNVSSDDIGLLGDQERPNGNELIVIAVINSARTFSATFASIRPTMLVVDECHRSGSSENARALSGEFQATLGLSATPERDYDQGFQEHVAPILGDIIYDYSYADAAADGVISPFGLDNVYVDLLPDEQNEYARLTRLIHVRRKEAVLEPGDVDYRLQRLLQRRSAVSANATIRIPASVRLVESHRGERSIIFHERIDAADTILRLLLERGHRATIYHSGIGVEMRRENLRLFRKGVFDVLV